LAGCEHATVDRVTARSALSILFMRVWMKRLQGWLPHALDLELAPADLLLLMRLPLSRPGRPVSGHGFDRDPAVYAVLMAKVFPGQATLDQLAAHVGGP
jgi:hypothetical protein